LQQHQGTESSINATFSKRNAAHTRKSVLQVIYDNTTAAAAVVAEAITTTTAVAGRSSSSSSSTGQQQQAARLKQQQRRRHQRNMLQELAAAAGAEDVLQEPQLLLVFGPVLTLAGYPPYHARVAEIQHLGQLVSVRRNDVDAAFAGYCQVLQRHGA
jgi:hypothetical protein